MAARKKLTRTLTAVQERWLKALESDEYEQGMRYLCTQNGDDQFCCLGVACELYVTAHKEVEGWEECVKLCPSLPGSENDGRTALKIGTNTKSLPGFVALWLGVKTH